jgi:hypothetical protein
MWPTNWQSIALIAWSDGTGDNLSVLVAKVVELICESADHRQEWLTVAHIRLAWERAELNVTAGRCDLSAG